MSLWASLLLVAGGGALGAALRFTVWQGMLALNLTPYLVVVNAAGCGALGAILALPIRPASVWYLFGVMGVLGGFTTLSAVFGHLLRGEYAGGSPLAWSAQVLLHLAVPIAVGYACFGLIRVWLAR